MRRELFQLLDHEAEMPFFVIDGATRVAGLFLPASEPPINLNSGRSSASESDSRRQRRPRRRT